MNMKPAMDQLWDTALFLKYVSAITINDGLKFARKTTATLTQNILGKLGLLMPWWHKPWAMSSHGIDYVG